MIDKIKLSLSAQSSKILSDRGIGKAILDGDITINTNYTNDQLQPATFDVRMGKVRVYDDESVAQNVDAFIKQPQSFEFEPSTDFARIYEDEKDIPIIIPPKSYFEVFLHDDISFNKDKYLVDVDLRSSRGRLGLRLSSNSIQYENGMPYLSLQNLNSNPIKLYGQSKFAQMFFYPKYEPSDGYIVNNPIEAKDIAEKIIPDSDFEMIGPYIIFNLCDHIFEFKDGFGEIDTEQKYSEDDLYILRDTTNPVQLELNKPVIAQLQPRIELPDNVGLQILQNIPYSHNKLSLENWITFENQSANAGWGDPGYMGNITAHLYLKRFPRTLKRGDSIAIARIFRYNQPVKRPYGYKDLESHYHKSNGSVSKS
ncbi:MAG: hypothetical protein K0B02_01545 [DPANN group archaeon]|nr:hypothetical protein [DPANN group archaeon]